MNERETNANEKILKQNLKSKRTVKASTVRGKLDDSTVLVQYLLKKTVALCSKNRQITRKRLPYYLPENAPDLRFVFWIKKMKMISKIKILCKLPKPIYSRGTERIVK